MFFGMVSYDDRASQEFQIISGCYRLPLGFLPFVVLQLTAGVSVGLAFIAVMGRSSRLRKEASLAAVEKRMSRFSSSQRARVACPIPAPLAMAYRVLPALMAASTAALSCATASMLAYDHVDKRSAIGRRLSSAYKKSSSGPNHPHELRLNIRSVEDVSQSSQN